jgi:hypothetical protein|tara:strand:+ start:1115 stop:1312 length:198 start_codon:yes stop_codon:yes gene_type:complete
LTISTEVLAWQDGDVLGDEEIPGERLVVARESKPVIESTRWDLCVEDSRKDWINGVEFVSIGLTV